MTPLSWIGAALFVIGLTGMIVSAPRVYREKQNTHRRTKVGRALSARFDHDHVSLIGSILK